jgi:chorismate mutase
MVHIPKAENRPGIYTICHLPSNSVYVGQANKVVSRWNQHLKQLRAGSHHNGDLQHLWSRDPEYHFQFAVVKYAAEGLSPLALQRWLNAEELALFNTIKDTCSCLNIATPVIKSTRKAVEEFKDEKRTREKEHDARISNHRRSIKEQITHLENLIGGRLRAIRRLESDAREAEARIKAGSGWKTFFFGKPEGYDRVREEQVLARLRQDISALRGDVDPIVANIHRLEAEYRRALNLFSKVDRRRTQAQYRRWGIPHEERKIE